MLVTYITKIYRSLLQSLCCLVLHNCEAMKQDSIYSKLPFKYFRNRHMSVNKLEKLPRIVSIVDISK